MRTGKKPKLGPYDNIRKYAEAQWIFHEKFGKPITHAWKFKHAIAGSKPLVHFSGREWDELLTALRNEYKRLNN